MREKGDVIYTRNIRETYIREKLDFQLHSKTVSITRRIRNRRESCSSVSAPIFGGLHETGSRTPEMNVTRIRSLLTARHRWNLHKKKGKKIFRSIEVRISCELEKAMTIIPCVHIIYYIYCIILYLYFYHSIYLANKKKFE